ncbi:LytR/AlgR family response regulator transcription factor [Clostridium frigidicarnis]|uniref:DNA-binding response regulator, LytR/AlgR family n=1 Tax=Clostridium frigidicarnis TaxID=84698 RepID=A0A1I0ZII0_9CLOT|nr:LytTR family DNA-binding domain-containing protein [Clostridium frigidicarnis]SFB24926.1 DNA-binding response regulator, LytR/AlgR family [Clostridium frigidicarnis]
MHRNVAIIGENMNSINEYLYENGFLNQWKISSFNRWSDFENNISNNIDIIFINTDLECGNGIDLIKNHKSTLRNTVIIIVSKSENFAYEAFNIDAFQYILEPMDKSRLNLIWNKAVDFIDYMDSIKLDNRIFTISTKDTIHKVKYKDIWYFEKILRKVRVVKKDGVIEYYGTFKELEESLDFNFFIQCHQSFIVNKNKIHIYKNQQIRLENLNITIPVSKAYVRDIRNKIS